MRLRVFASGSRGNVLGIRASDGAIILVDCGLSCRELTHRAADCGVDLNDVRGILFTHDHADHIGGLATFVRRHPGVALYANGDTADAIAAKTGVAGGWTVFETAVPFSIGPLGDRPLPGGNGPLEVTPFSVSHDAADPVGYLIAEGESVLFVGTDTGIVTAGFRDAFSRATCAVLESNHDLDLLSRSERPPSLKQRIAGRSGHLSNDDAADLVRDVRPTRLKHLLLAHLSQECNAPHLALDAMRDALEECGRSDLVPEVLEQDAPGPLVAF